MWKSTRSLTVVGLACASFAVATDVGARQPESELYYAYTFYSDASMTSAVGYYREYCLNNLYVITPQVTGETSPYYSREAIGRCPGLGDW